MPIKQFDIDLNDNDQDGGWSFLFIADAQLLLRPVMGPQYYGGPYDALHAISILGLGREDDAYTCHIVSRDNPVATQRQLDSVLHAFVDSRTLQLDCDATVIYHNADGTVASHAEYGVDNNNYTMSIDVWCDVRPLPNGDDLKEIMSGVLPDDDIVDYVEVTPDETAVGRCVVSGYVVHNPDLSVPHDC